MTRDPLGRMLFILAYFHHVVATHFTYVFISFINDMHIVSPISNAVLVFLQLYVKFITLGLSI
jgi:hypothetical protein